MGRPADYEARREVNDSSRNQATHHTEPWLAYELETLMLWDGSESELRDLAELLGRTIEACRQRYYVARRGESSVVVERTTTTTTTTTSVRWSSDDDAEWPEEWYTRG